MKSFSLMRSTWKSIIFHQYLLAGIAGAVLTNRTIDDQDGDKVTGFTPQYSPYGVWNQGNGCVTCAIHPDPGKRSMFNSTCRPPLIIYNRHIAQAFEGTWHDTQVLANVTIPYTITIQFNGKQALR